MQAGEEPVEGADGEGDLAQDGTELVAGGESSACNRIGRTD